MSVEIHREGFDPRRCCRSFPFRRRPAVIGDVVSNAELMALFFAGGGRSGVADRVKDDPVIFIDDCGHVRAMCAVGFGQGEEVAWRPALCRRERHPS